jgi:small ligand-binding sensory domain FIST
MPMSTAFRYGHAAAEDWLEAAKQSLAQAGAVPPAANLGFLYLTDYFAGQAGEILAYLRHHTGVEHWVGSVGMGISSTGTEYFDSPAMALMLGEFPPGSFEVLAQVGEEELERPEALAWNGTTANFAVIHGDPHNGQLSNLIARFASHTESGFVVGGLTSSRSDNVQIADGLAQGSLSGVLFSAEVGVATRMTQGCAPIGTHHEITQCQRNVVVQIDGRPALEVFKEDIGEVLARDLERASGYIFAGLPIPGSDTGDYLVRNLLGFDTQNKLLAIGEMVGNGDPIMFCRRDAAAAEEDMHRMLGELREQLDGPPRGGLYYSCLGRGANLFGPNSEELRMIRESLGDFPLVGFFANGEISHNRLYGYTGVLTLFT